MNEEIIFILDLIGTFAFACSGALMAINKKMDPIGVIIIAFVTAIGGGTLRDVLIGNFPVNWIQNGTLIAVIFGAAVFSMLADTILRKLPTTLLIFDAIGLGIFTIYGIEYGLHANLGMGVCIALGTITACFGGVIRDTLMNNVPLIFHKEIYATTCVIGGLLYFLLRKFEIDINFTRYSCIAIIIILRIIVVYKHWSIPKFYLKDKNK
ncbi:MAG TPA: trimeric intracellular cation channel family protein [Chitinophagaceae bacterium]|nr:trimeric intracellular cation channel family protein [Chitinophagaceae bacterium]